MSLENMKDEMKWLLFRGIVCHLLEKHEYNGNPWLFSGCLDMSFEELSGAMPIDEWLPLLEKELIEYKRSDGKYEFNSNFK